MNIQSFTDEPSTHYHLGDYLTGFTVIHDKSSKSKEETLFSTDASTLIPAIFEPEIQIDSFRNTLTSNTQVRPDIQEYELKFNEQIDVLFNAIHCELSNQEEEYYYDESSYSLLIDLINQYSDYFIQKMISYILMNEHDAYIVSELLVKIGEINRNLMSDNLRWLLERALFSDNIKVRYGALVGLTYNRSKSSLPYLEISYKNKGNKRIAKDIENLISKIKSERLT